VRDEVGDPEVFVYNGTLIEAFSAETVDEE